MYLDLLLAALPPIIAIVLALITKEVYFSLLIGILSGALVYSNFNPIGMIESTFEVMNNKVGGNVYIIIFLVLLGMVVALMTKSGASSAYGRWASKSISSKRGASFATAGLGALIFVDDYFNCLTVGAVMRPVTDRFKMSRAKLAYIIDATAAPVCIIAPISSWAAAVSSSLPESSTTDGFSLFLRTIPFNLYALLTLAMIVIIVWLKFDFGKMRKCEELMTELPEAETSAEASKSKGRVFDLVLPIVVLIVSCILFMLYTGGFFSGVDFVTAFGDCSSAKSLALGSFVTIVFIAALYLPRKVISFKQFTESLTDGFKAMVPAILILTLAWTLSGICGEGYLDLGNCVKNVLGDSSLAIGFMPAIFFAIALGLAFATGTSWGTFGILIPIALAVLGDGMSNALVYSVAATLAGAVCGDHISPISDTTILASAGADCNHIEHVSTQIPYAMIVAACSFIGYLITGLLDNGWLGLGVGFVLLAACLGGLYTKSKKTAK
ncbi:MAG: Na+/H+ antiporter NhaC family protein [Ruminococcaceae bacterium]|nr:Na+/H+ antiporter NhaC family protein [Oscillospiraceae bacterium]